MVFTNPTRAMECPLLARLTNMPRLLQLEDLEHHLSTGVIVRWAEAWVTMVVPDRLSRLKIPKALRVVAPSVEDMIHLPVAALTQVKTNTTTMPTKAISRLLVTT